MNLCRNLKNPFWLYTKSNVNSYSQSDFVNTQNHYVLPTFDICGCNHTFFIWKLSRNFHDLSTIYKAFFMWFAGMCLHTLLMVDFCTPSATSLTKLWMNFNIFLQIKCRAEENVCSFSSYNITNFPSVIHYSVNFSRYSASCVHQEACCTLQYFTIAWTRSTTVRRLHT